MNDVVTEIGKNEKIYRWYMAWIIFCMILGSVCVMKVVTTNIEWYTPDSEKQLRTVCILMAVGSFSSIFSILIQVLKMNAVRLCVCENAVYGTGISNFEVKYEDIIDITAKSIMLNGYMVTIKTRQQAFVVSHLADPTYAVEEIKKRIPKN